MAIGCDDDDNQNKYQPQPAECFPSSIDDVEIALTEGNFLAPFASKTMTIDGCSKEDIWTSQDWYSLNYRWMGATPDSLDYYGRFKLAWDAGHLYILVETVDDSLSPTLVNGLSNYWKGDYVEVFLDEDQSGGIHQYNHQAFAYHVSTEGHSIDQSTQQQAIFFDDHVEIARTKDGDRYLWELAVKVFDDQFDEYSSTNVPVTLTSGKVMGFSLAYGDNDGNNSRENFMGSRESHGVNNDEGYVNSNVFGSVTLID